MGESIDDKIRQYLSLLDPAKLGCAEKEAQMDMRASCHEAGVLREQAREAESRCDQAAASLAWQRTGEMDDRCNAATKHLLDLLIHGMIQRSLAGG